MDAYSAVFFFFDEEGLLVEVHSVISLDERFHVLICQIDEAQSVRSCNDE